MQLDANGTVTREAGLSDVSRAFAARPPNGEWSITLEDADGSYLQAFSAEGRKCRLTSRKDNMQTDGLDQLDAEAAGKVLMQYLSGDPAWREAMDWKAAPSSKLTAALRDVFTDEAKGPDIQPALPSATPPTSSASAVVGLLWLAATGLILYGAITRGPAMIAAYFPRAVGDPRLAVLVGSMGLFALLFGIASLVQAVRARSWPTVLAEVTSSKVEEGTSSIGTGGNRSSYRSFIPRVEYRYTVEGKSYLSQHILLGGARNPGQDSAEQIVARYPVGARVAAYYDPSNPGRAFLEYTVIGPVLGFALAVVFLAFFAHLVNIF